MQGGRKQGDLIRLRGQGIAFWGLKQSSKVTMSLPGKARGRVQAASNQSDVSEDPEPARAFQGCEAERGPLWPVQGEQGRGGWQELKLEREAGLDPQGRYTDKGLHPHNQ